MLRNRLLTLAIVGSFLGLLRALAPAAEQRAVCLYLIALPLGYGHLIGAAAFARPRSARAEPARGSRRLAAAFAASSALTLLALYDVSLGVPALAPWVLLPMLVFSAWHIAENDLALGRAYRSGLRLAALPRSLRHHLLALARTAAIGFAAFATADGAALARAWFGAELPAPGTWLSLDELLAAALLHHAVSWLVFFEDRARALRPRAARDAALLRRRVLALHAAPLALAAALYLWLPSLFVGVASPLLYLFWSVLHAGHTAALRGVEARRAAA